MDYSGLTKAVVDNIVLPIIVVIGGALLTIVKTYAKKITESIIANNDVATLGNITSVKNNLLMEICTTVQAAVFTNMTIAESLKEGGRKLADQEISMLQESTKKLVYQALPDSLTDENGVMLKVIGGKDKLDAIISSNLEQAVISAKAKMALIKK